MKEYCELCGNRRRKRVVEATGETLCTRCSKGKAQYEREHGGRSYEEVNKEKQS